MQLSTLLEWLNWLETKQANPIELGLERIKKVALQLQLLKPACPVVMVAGTNGKGSTVAGLAAIYSAAGFRVGTFTSPYLIKPNEQITLAGRLVTDEELIQAFNEIENARERTSDKPNLTYFEYFTLAAFLILTAAKLDVWVVEIGLGGRLDAVNILDANLAIITSIGIDHVDWLGPTREHIGVEKAGIFRPRQSAVCGDMNPPASLLHEAEKLGTQLFCVGKDFMYQENNKQNDWQWHSGTCHRHYTHLPIPKLALENMATVLMAVTLMQDHLPVTEEQIRDGLTAVTLSARLQTIPSIPPQLLDVAHNPDSVAMLVKQLRRMQLSKVHAVFSMLKDKDIVSSIMQIKKLIKHWYVAPLTDKRAADLQQLQDAFAKAGIEQVTFFPSLAEAYEAAMQQAAATELVLTFGSFHTVAKVMQIQNVTPDLPAKHEQ